MTRARTVFLLATLLFSYFVFVGVAPDAQAGHIGCGAVLGPGGNFALDSNVGPCATNPAISVDSAKLDMKGFKVTCDGSGDGILLTGTEARLTGGTPPGASEQAAVEGCVHGVVVSGQGRHVVDGVLASNNSGDGFRVESDRNKLDQNVAENNGVDGFAVLGRQNKLPLNGADGNAGIGFVLSGNENELTQAFTIANQQDGVLVTGNDNMVSRVATLANSFGGVVIAGGGNRVDRSVSIANGDDGYTVTGDGNTLTRNGAEDNDGDGIEVTGQNNIISGNTATGHDSAGAFDLADTNANCDGNVWTKNSFDTASQPCIR